MRSVANEAGALILEAPDYVQTRVLGAGTAESITVPAGAVYVNFGKPTAVDFFASYSGTAVVPGADVNDGTSNEQNPTLRRIVGITTISIISAGAAIVTASFYL